MSDPGIVETKFFEYGSPDEPFRLESGEALGGIRLAYETYGELNEARSNAIVVYHALSGSQHAAGLNTDVEGNPLWTDECHRGWWDLFIGPGKPLDTDKYFIVCANCLGGCYGSTGPRSIDPETGRPYGSRFPDITLGDAVRAEMPLLDHLGIDRVLAAIGGSMGGMQALDMAIQFPERVRLVVPIGSCARTTALSRLLNFEQLFALQEDPNFKRGDYYEADEQPYQGLVLARMIAHKTFISLAYLAQRSTGFIVQEENDLKGYRLRHQIESYMLHQGKKFSKRFDANTYVKILTALQTFDVAATYGDGSLPDAIPADAGHRYLVVSIDSDVCHYTEEQSELVEALKARDVDYRYVTVHSEKGHDSFLIEPELYAPMLTYMLAEELERA